MQNYPLSAKREAPTLSQESKIRQINNYISNRVNPILGPLQMELMIKQPSNINQFCIHWLENYNLNARQDEINLESDQQPDEVFKEKIRKKIKNRKRCRVGVSGQTDKQVVQAINERPSVKFDWPQQMKISLIMNLKKCVFFQHLSTQNLLKLISHMRIIEYKGGDIVIKQGEHGNQLYIVEQGIFKCEKEDSLEQLKRYSAGQIFGQLSLLYNHPRASTITAMTNGKIFGLARQQFSLVLRSNMISKLRQCEQLVSKIQIFQNLNIYERSKLCQSMEVRIVGAQKYIIKQGEVGNCFYVVGSGQLVAYKMQKKELKLVYTYKRGDYFGQIALMKNIPRQASIKTITEAKLIYIDRQTFSRVLGPLQIILKRNQQRYLRLQKQFNEELS